LDDEENRQVNRDEGVNLAKEYGLDDLQFIETSAKTGVNVKQLFKNLATSLPGITSSSGQLSSAGYGQASSAGIRAEGGSALGNNERFKLSANGG